MQMYILHSLNDATGTRDPRGNISGDFTNDNVSKYVCTALVKGVRRFRNVGITRLRAVVPKLYFEGVMMG